MTTLSDIYIPENMLGMDIGGIMQPVTLDTISQCLGNDKNIDCSVSNDIKGEITLQWYSYGLNSKLIKFYVSCVYDDPLQ